MSRALLVMRENDTLYGLWAETVREVVPAASVTSLPKKLSYFEGIMNYKGNMVPVFSLARISGKEETGEKAEKMLVMVENQKGNLGLAVSEVLQVTEQAREQMNWEDKTREDGVLSISQVVREGGKEPVFVLDMEQILDKILSMEM